MMLPMIVIAAFAAGLGFGRWLFERRWRRERLVLQGTADRLKEQLEVKDEYVAKVSHELRTPLTAIKEGIGLVLDGSLGDVNAEQRDFLKTADESIDRLTELISNILDLAKIEAGRLRLVRRKLAMPALTESLLNSYRMVAGQRRVEVERGDVPEVFADPNRIMQVIGNLFSNAVKFTAPDGVIRVSMRRDKDSVVVSVADNGSGIAAEDVQRLFQKFSQVGGGQTRLRGTGLGLALCKELIELHGGTVGVESTLGRGSVFSFTLPVYTPKLALEESFRELADFTGRTQQLSVGVLALVIDPGSSGEDPGRAERVAECVRTRVQQGDTVLTVDPESVAVLAITDAKGIRAMAERLSGLGVSGADRFRCGWAIAPADGADIAGLLAKALTRI